MQRILIVEDDATISGGIRLYLQGKGFAADCAGTIARAETLLAGSSLSSDPAGYSSAGWQWSGTLQSAAENQRCAGDLSDSK